MTSLASTRRLSPVAFALFLLLAVGAGSAGAQGFVSPFIGYNFSGDAGCPNITKCDDKRADYGAAFGFVGSILGIESEFGYTKDFFGSSSAQTSNVFTFMANFMLAPKISFLQPYGVIGLGTIHTSVEATATNANASQDQFSWDAGGGVIVYFNDHIGVRTDVRYFRSFDVLNLLNLPDLPDLPLNDSKLDYGRIAIAGMFKF